MKDGRKLARTGIFLGCILISLAIRSETIRSTSPTFDEPYYLYEGVHFRQSGERLEPSIHPPFHAWLVGELSPLIAKFENAPLLDRPYQFRMDLFSGLPGTEALDRLRWFLQPIWFLSVLAWMLAAAHAGMPAWGRTLLGAFLLLDPVYLGLSSQVGLDWMVIAILGFAMALALVENAALSAFSVALFALAWATKLSAALWAAPLLLAIVCGKIPKKVFAFYAAGGIVILMLVLRQPGQLDLSSGSRIWAWNLREGFLDGQIFLRTPWHYFAQAMLCKSSLAALLAMAIALRGSRARIPLSLFSASVLASFILPGLGIRIALPLAAAATMLACYRIRSGALASALVALLWIEIAGHHHAILAYQNPLAGSEPRLVDSHRDWGQGLKELAEWRNRHPYERLALALFGGTPPETYGITQYRSLPSFPELENGEPLVMGGFSGFVAVSENYLHGYIVDDPNVRALASRKPIQCFQDVLCLYDVRSAP